MRQSLWLALIVAATASRAEAHAFEVGAEPYAQFVEGAGVIVATPGILLPLLVMGIAIGLWDPEGLPRVWPVALLGQVAGLFSAPLVGTWVGPAVIALGAVVAMGAALWPANRLGVMAGLAGLTGLGAMTAALEGHGLFELSVFVHAGVVFGANLMLAAGAGVSALALTWGPAPGVRIALRIIASWIGAILVLVFALALRGGIS